jgi:hypothetical protein
MNWPRRKASLPKMPIKIDGSTRRSFIFPAAVDQAFAYYSDLNQTFACLPHILIVKKYSATSYRLLYNTTELGVFRVRIFCDLEAFVDRHNRILSFQPMKGSIPIESTFDLHSLQAQGSYSSQSRFNPVGKQTRVDYVLHIEASLPTPLAAYTIPSSMRNSLASSITTWRIREIADGFIERSIKKYYQA